MMLQPSMAKKARGQNWLSSLGVRNSVILFLLLIRALTNCGFLWACIRRRGQIALSSKCAQLPFNVAWAAVWKIWWLDSHVLEETCTSSYPPRLVMRELGNGWELTKLLDGEKMGHVWTMVHENEKMTTIQINIWLESSTVHWQYIAVWIDKFVNIMFINIIPSLL